MEPRTLVAAYFALLGLVVGSFLNVVIYRLPRGLSTVLPRSACPSCGARVRAWDNVPIFSWVLLRGRCRHCRTAIHWRYPLVEALTGLAFLAAFVRFDDILSALVAAAFSAALLALAAIDVEHFILPDAITLPGIVIGLALAPWLGWTSLYDSPLLSAAVGALAGGGVLLALIGVWYLLRGELGMGFGDVKMLAMVGAFLGVEGVIVTLFFASVSGALTGVVLLSRSRLALQSKLPFGLFLALGGLVALFAGQALVDSYTTLL